MTAPVTVQQAADATPVGRVEVRAIEKTQGRIAYIEVSPHDAPATLTIRVVDPTGALDCVFLGRRLIPGLDPGAIVCVEGRVAEGDGVPRMYNPRYELCQP